MSRDNIMTKEDFIIQEILKSGLPLESYVSSCLNYKEWAIFENSYFLDKDENKSREIDLEIVREIEASDHRVELNLLIQCKKIPGNAWVFPKSHAKTYPFLACVTPHTSLSMKIFDEENTIAQKLQPSFTNYKEIIFDPRLSNKKTDNLFEAVITLIKAVAYKKDDAVQSQESFKELLEYDQEMGKDFLKNPFIYLNVFYPIVVFEGEMYELDFIPQPTLNKIKFAQIFVDYKSINYNGIFTIYVINKEAFKEFISKIENDGKIFKNRIEVSLKEINLKILEAFGLTK